VGKSYKLIIFGRLLLMNFAEIQNRLRAFAEERDWGQFHTPKNLAMAISGEAGELIEHFQWLTQTESESLSATVKHEVALEMADIMLYVLRLCDVLQVNPEEAIEQKLIINEQKYPVSLSKGNAKKYNRRND